MSRNITGKLMPCRYSSTRDRPTPRYCTGGRDLSLSLGAVVHAFVGLSCICWLRSPTCGPQSRNPCKILRKASSGTLSSTLLRHGNHLGQFDRAHLHHVASVLVPILLLWQKGKSERCSSCPPCACMTSTSSRAASCVSFLIAPIWLVLQGIAAYAA